MSPEFEKLVNDAFKFGLRDPDGGNDVQQQAALLAAAAVKFGFKTTEENLRYLREALKKFGYKKVLQEVFG